MSLLLTLVQSPRPQAVRQMRLEDGALVIGRSPDSDWPIDDPDQYVSRAHCTVAGRSGAFTVTDTSSGGLFVDDARAPLGPGRPLPLRDGMRLRLGDYVLRVELRPVAVAAPSAEPSAAAPTDTSGFFSEPRQEQPRPDRPRDLPDPFESPSSFVPSMDTAPPERRGGPEFDDPFTLDPPASSRHHERPAPPGFDSKVRAPSLSRSAPAEDRCFDWGEPKPQPSAHAVPDAAWDLSASSPAEPKRVPEPEPAPAAFDWGEPPAGSAEPYGDAPPPAPSATATGVGPNALLDAFLRGLGLDAADAPAGDPVARMEAFGREYRMMAEGLMQLLRLRAQEKGNARIAQTVVGASEVNPLKFMPTVEDALAVIVARRSGGFAGTDAAIAGALRDLTAHHIATWRGTQAALGRLIDRFDPAALERELESLGLLETLLAGGRRAKLWELYQKRFRSIAQSAETQFLGDVGAEFREAYERED
jgi:type VI secretion system protein ImpI